jgi:hypothetical protein
MIRFNQKLVKNTSNPVAAALVLFSIQEELNLYDLTRDDLNKAMNQLSVNGLLKDNGEGKLVVTRPIYSIDKVNQEPEISSLRKIFHVTHSGQPGKMGRKDEVEDALAEFYIKNPTVGFEEVLKACRAYVQECRRKNSFISKLPNFISGDLEVWVEEKIGIYEERSLLDRGR